MKVCEINSVQKSVYAHKAHNSSFKNDRNNHNHNQININNYAYKHFNSPINFKGYYGDIQPLKKMFWINTGRNTIYQDIWTKQHLIKIKNIKWINAHPNELLKRTPEQVIQSVCTIIKPKLQFPGIPPYIPSPNYGDKWGRFANYIEINPRLVAKMDNNDVSEGLLGVMKLLAAIPPQSGNSANCIILSQLYPSYHNDGNIYNGSLYNCRLHEGISKNLTSRNLIGKMGDDEQVKAFNDMAHLLGLKTGFRMLLSEGQMKVHDEDFNWNKHEKAFIDACVHGIELGFDSIYFDSCSHIIDRNGYMGVGNLPDKNKFSWILFQIRELTGRNDLSFIGEKCNNNYVFKEMGLTAGTDWGKADYINSVIHESEKQAHCREYAAGPEVSNDNDIGYINFETRLNRLNSCLWGFKNKYDKLPSFMQLHDIFPLSPYTNTHEAMLRTIKMNSNDGWTCCEKHWNGIFNTSDEAYNYTQNVFNIFKNTIANN